MIDNENEVGLHTETADCLFASVWDFLSLMHLDSLFFVPVLWNKIFGH